MRPTVRAKSASLIADLKQDSPQRTPARRRARSCRDTRRTHPVGRTVALARVVPWDTLGSFSVIPVGTAFAGHLAQELGTSAALTMAIMLMLVTTPAPLTIREVRLLTSKPTAAPSRVR